MTNGTIRYEDFWVKAKLFTNRVLDENKPFDERAFWAASALEMLAKSALSYTNPLLAVEFNAPGTYMLAASGLADSKRTVMTISAKSAFERCEKAFRPFDAGEADKVAQARNEYIHGVSLGFFSLPHEVWWQKFWPQVLVLVEAQGFTLFDLVGAAHIDSVESLIAENAHHIKVHVESLIESAVRRKEMRDSGLLTERVARTLGNYSSQNAGLKYHDQAECPACGSLGILEGEFGEIQETISHGDPDEGWWEAVDIVSVDSEYFSCESCGLVLDTYELVQETDLPDRFEIETEHSWEPEYMDE